jgi:DNA-binding NtrC family response regulator
MFDAVSIVVIDDNPGSLELISAALAQQEAQIYTAANPVQGLELVRKHRPRLGVTDLVMPDLSGLEVLQQVVSFDSSIDVVLMTDMGGDTAKVVNLLVGIGLALRGSSLRGQTTRDSCITGGIA